MHAAAEKVADMDPAHAGRRASIIDHTWDGIGDDVGRWWS